MTGGGGMWAAHSSAALRASSSSRCRRCGWRRAGCGCHGMGRWSVVSGWAVLWAVWWWVKARPRPPAR